MNFLWEVVLQAEKQGIPRSNLRFVCAKDFSAYMEVSEPYLNQQMLEDYATIEVNPYYRFYDIFKDMFRPDLNEFPQLRDSLTNLILHQLAENDRLSGMTREEYYKKLLYQDFMEEVFGKKLKAAVSLFEKEEQEILLSGLLRQYETGSSLDLFTDIIEALIPDNIVYHSNQNSYEILIYIGRKKEKKLVEKLEFLISMFAELTYNIDVYYEYHFGVLGMEETMIIDEITMC